DNRDPRSFTTRRSSDLNEDLSYKEKFFYIWNRLVDYYIAHKETFWFIEQFYSSPYYELITQKKTTYYGVDKMHLFFEEGIKSGILRNVSFYTLISIYIESATSHVKMVTYGFCKMQAKGRAELIEIIWNGVKNQYQ